jgi:hypothetical protein
MSVHDLGQWRSVGLGTVIDTFSSAPFRWWVTGGHALELHLGRSWRTHGDTDVGVVRSELDAVYSWLADWDLHIAAAGQLTPWRGEPLRKERHENNVWCRRGGTEYWRLDLTIGEGSDTAWIYRRDPGIQVPWDLAVLHNLVGVPYLAPELQLLYKSERPRPKDDTDAAEVIPSLSDRQRGFLVRSLDSAHPWQRLLA